MFKVLKICKDDLCIVHPVLNSCPLEKSGLFRQPISQITWTSYSRQTCDKDLLYNGPPALWALLFNCGQWLLEGVLKSVKWCHPMKKSIVLHYKYFRNIQPYHHLYSWLHPLANKFNSIPLAPLLAEFAYYNILPLVCTVGLTCGNTIMQPNLL